MAKAKAAKETPLMKQYNQIKSRYPGALLLFRVGDFYETFGEDAVKAAKTLEIVLTKRANGAASHIELAGFPHHALDNYLPRLVRAGHRVAICDQLEDPKATKGIVKRGVTELVTPGLSFNDNVLDQTRNNYLASIHITKGDIGVSFLDLSTGEFMLSQGPKPYIDKLLQGFKPSEVIYSKGVRQQFDADFGDEFNCFTLEDWVYQKDFAYERLTDHFNTATLKGFGVEDMPEGIIAAGAILYYCEQTEHKEIAHLNALSRIEEDRYVWLDKFTIRNLELLTPQQEGGVPLIAMLDQTHTPMGARMLKKWMVLPLKDKVAIEERQTVVKALAAEPEKIGKITETLRHIGDVERLISKVAVGRINPREMQQLKRALNHTLPVKETMAQSGVPQLVKLADQLNPCDFLRERMESHLKEDPPLVTNQGNLIADGIDPQLDEYRSIAFSGKDYLLQIQQRESERTGISSLKIAYNKVFGYYLEVTNAHKDKVPEEWIRKQTLVNAERYITEELKNYEEKILKAEEQLSVIEQRIFASIVNEAAEYITQIQQNARVLARIDCLTSFAITAEANAYACPVLTDGREVNITEGRHPVIEQQLPPGEHYVPNDVFLDDETQQIMIITGPNMAGKSALLRQTALIVLMAQMGSFVPAKAAQLGVVDKVFTRVGASDNLSRGESTFMVEMIETSSILNNLSDRSLVLMDEIGRGTSTYDGISIAWSIVEYLHNHPKHKAKTLFATHYHELNQLAEDFSRVKNFNVSVKEVDNQVIFLRKLKPGGSEHSFGIHVAQMAGMPNPVVLRASEIMGHLEAQRGTEDKTKEALGDMPKKNFQLSLFEEDPRWKEVQDILAKIDINAMPPVEALLKLNAVKAIVDRKE